MEGKAGSVPSIPVLRFGEEYESLEQVEVRCHRTGEVRARVSQANAGMLRRDLARRAGAAAEALRARSPAELLEACVTAEKCFLHERLPLNASGASQSPQEYVEALSATSGLPHALCRANMAKVATVLRAMPQVLRGLTLGLPLEVLERGRGEHCGVPVSYFPQGSLLGVVLPSNSPGVNSLWMPAIPLRVPVLLKPGREEPWTPLRIVQALIAAGCPREAFGFYSTDHEGAAAILAGAPRNLLFGDENTTRAYAHDPAVQIHGPGRSKVVVGADRIEQWRDFVDVMVESVAQNGGRSCINASTIVVPAHGDAIAEELALRLARLEPRPLDDPEARLAAFANPKVAEWIDRTLDQGLAQGGAVDVTARHRSGPRHVVLDGSAFLLPTVVRCDSPEHPLARTEFLFPFVAVVEVPREDLVEALGPSLVVTAITEDAALAGALLRASHVDRLNLGPLPTTRVEWDQPHEGNLFEFLYRRRAVQGSGAAAS